MGCNSFKTLVVMVMLAAFAAEARAQEGIVLPKNPGVVALRSGDNERRPPQSAPQDSTKTSAPLDRRKVRKAVGGLIAVLAVVVTGSVLGRSFGEH